jgi:hypothetical protein
MFITVYVFVLPRYGIQEKLPILKRDLYALEVSFICSKIAHFDCDLDEVGTHEVLPNEKT